MRITQRDKMFRHIRHLSKVVTVRMARTRLYDRLGNQIDYQRWWQLRADVDYRLVAADDLDNCQIETVWLGVDPRAGDQPPRIFETRIHGGTHDGCSQLYCTDREAREGHCRIANDLENGIPPWWMARKMV